MIESDGETFIQLILLISNLEIIPNNGDHNDANKLNGSNDNNFGAALPNDQTTDNGSYTHIRNMK